MVNVLIFPGQGAQRVGMARDLAERFPEARDTLAAIDDALGVALSRLMAEGPDEELQATSNAQPAILAHSATVLAVAGARLAGAIGAAGHSLGEYSAYVAAGSLTPVDAARVVRRRGELMQQAGSERPGTMAAVVGLDAAGVIRACREATAEGPGEAVAANLNAPDQVVISGDPTAVARAGERCRAAGAKRVIPLKVSGAFHSPLMAPAAAGLAEVLAGVSFADPRVPVIANASASPVRTAGEARRLLVEQLTAPVRWVECIRALATLAPEVRFVEVGPGTVLSGLVRRILPGANCLALGTADELEGFVG